MQEYFSGFDKFKFNENIRYSENYWLILMKKEETLEEHSELCVKYLKLLTTKKNLNIILIISLIYFEEKSL